MLRYRNWGADISLALTEKFSVQLDLVFPGVHPELEACARGGRVADSYYKNWQTLAGLGDTFITERRQRTEQLLKQSPQDLFSEVQIAASGELKIRDGHHRAGLARLHGLKNHNVVVTVKVDLA